MTPYRMLIDGELVEGATTSPVLDPATETVVGHAACCSVQQLERAVSAADAAFPDWAAAELAVRRDAVQRMGTLIRQEAEAVARLLTAEQGKPLPQALAEVQAAGDRCIETAELDLDSEVLRHDNAGTIVLQRIPLGVVAAIVPWNFPIILAMLKVAPALLAGNTVVLKPSPLTPLSTLLIATILADTFPPGVFNVISGDDALGPLLTCHARVSKVSFTGSTATGRRVMAGASDTLKRITLELGGNDAAIVMNDVDVDRIVEPLFWSAVRNSGQLCVASKRIYVHSDIYDSLLQAFEAFAAGLIMGRGDQPGVQIGPLQNKTHFIRTCDLIRECEANGLAMKTLVAAPTQAAGFFVPVLLVDNPPEQSRIVQEEQFAPIVPFIKFSNVDEVIDSVNNGSYGLGASVWAADENISQMIADRLRVGSVWINQGPANAPKTPFAGLRQSGIGVEGGREGLLEFTAVKILNRKVT